MNRETFVTLHKTRLFTADQVVDIVQSERDKLDKLRDWIKEFQSGRDSAYMEVVLKPVLEKIEELRWAGSP